MKILIDNGHGQNTPGKKSPFSLNKIKPELPFEEWRWNRQISSMLFSRLKAEGYDPFLLVPEMYDVSLAERCRRANAFGNNAILVSIHANACGNGDAWNTARGWCAFTSVGKTKADKLADLLYAEAKNLFPNGTYIRKDRSDGDDDQESNFYILKHTVCPAVLTENFFYTNVEDVKYMTSPAGMKAVVDVHVNAVKSFISSL